ncbi:acyl-CoA transferase [Afipia sp. P52-10]|uniref:CaiB/BaiF CoA transferase family protein n=1 Tax=Afipia sp. P52-10 TaxID=1429916 RepID=UPI0003DF1ED7|nr:CoA transferase [Afipia sp. P52-10]ETR77549.1 acyl-CoA transferase [Afipia sp. P52-10]
MTRPFDGVRILDFTQVLAGPYATFQFALMGADVVKVERREGEDLRYMDMRRTPLSNALREQGLMPRWQAVNAGKRSLTLDLQKPEAIAIVKQLAAEADVVAENFRPGVMDRLGIGYAALSALNPRLIYCSISAFGQTGPDRLGAGYDGKIQAMSGLMAMTGHASTGPTRAGFAVCDVIAGSTAAFAIASALYHRSQTGKGQLIDVSMLEAAIAFLSSEVADFTMTGVTPALMGNRAVSLAPTADLFATGDGYILLAVTFERQVRALMQGLGRADVLDDPRFADEIARGRNETALREIIETALAAKSAREWETILNEAGAPCASIWTLQEILGHPQIAARQAIHEVPTSNGPARLAGLGFKLAHGGGAIDRPAPRLGEHNDEVLAAAGYTADARDTLRKNNVI